MLTVIEELRRRQGLKGGIGGRSSQALYPLLKFLQKHIGDPRYTSTLCEIANLVLDIYSEVAGTVSEIDEMFLKLYNSVRNEVIFDATEPTDVTWIDYCCSYIHCIP